MHALQGVTRDQAERAQMEEQIGGEQCAEQHQHEVVALAAGLDQHAAEGEGRQRQEGQVREREQWRGTGDQRQPAGKPERGERGQNRR